MGATIGAFVLSYIAPELAASPLAAEIVGAVIITAAAVGIQAATAPGAPSPSVQKQVIKQPIGPRLRFYGENKVGGTYAMCGHGGFIA